MGQLLVITSGKGGTGKSSLAVGIGSALYARGRTVLLVDASAGLRCLDLMLGISSEILFDIGDVLHARCKPSQAVQTTASGLVLMPGAQRPEDFTDPQEIKNLFTVLAGCYDYVLVDSPPGIGRGFSLALSGADNALVVVTPDEVCLRDAYEVGRHLRSLEVQNVRLVINRFLPTLIWSGAIPDVDHMIDRTGIRLLGIVPEDGTISLSAANGAPPHKGRAKMAFQRIAARIDGEAVPLPNLKRL